MVKITVSISGNSFLLSAENPTSELTRVAGYDPAGKEFYRSKDFNLTTFKTIIPIPTMSGTYYFFLYNTSDIDLADTSVTYTPVKPPAVGDVETYFDSYHGYNIYTVSGSYTARRPSGTSIGFFTSLQGAFDGIDADLVSLQADVDRAAREAAKAAADKAAADAALALEEAAKDDGTDKTDYSMYIVAAVVIVILLILILRRK